MSQMRIGGTRRNFNVTRTARGGFCEIALLVRGYVGARAAMDAFPQNNGVHLL